MNPPSNPPPRHDPRIHVGLRVQLKFGWRGAETIEASVSDISESGLHIRSHAPLRQGMDLQVVFENNTDEAKTYQVVWVRASEFVPNAFEIGLELKH